MDATLNFALGVAFDVGLFFITGGVGIIKSFSYLRYITVIGRAFKAGQGAAYTVLVLEGMGSAAEIFTLLSSTCTRYYDFMKEKADAGEDTTQYEALHKMFFYLTILGAGASLAMKSLAINQAKLVKGASYFDSLPLEVRNSVNSLAGVEVAQIENFRQNRIGAHQEITSKFDLWGEGKKNVFFDDFKNAPDDVLLQMNNADVIANWEKLYAENILDRNLLSTIKEAFKTNQIIDYYKSYRVRQLLSSQSTKKRWDFFDDFKDAPTIYVNEFKNNYQYINYWERFRYESNLIQEFKSLNIDEKMDWIKSCGKIQKPAMERLITYPKIFRNWKALSIEDKILFRMLPDEYIKSAYQYHGFLFFRKFCPQDISESARIFPTVKKGYYQVEFRFTKDDFKWEIRAHTEIPNSPGVGNGDVWVIKKTKISDGTFSPYSEFLSNDEWIQGHIWYGLIKKQAEGTITEAEKLILKNGHFKVK